MVWNYFLLFKKLASQVEVVLENKNSSPVINKLAVSVLAQSNTKKQKFLRYRYCLRLMKNDSVRVSNVLFNNSQ